MISLSVCKRLNASLAAATADLKRVFHRIINRYTSIGGPEQEPKPNIDGVALDPLPPPPPSPPPSITACSSLPPLAVTLSSWECVRDTWARPSQCNQDQFAHLPRRVSAGAHSGGSAPIKFMHHHRRRGGGGRMSDGMQTNRLHLGQPFTWAACGTAWLPLEGCGC